MTRKNERLKEIEEKYDFFVKMAFPQFPESDELSDWVTQLAEIDSYYAGIASSFISHGEYYKVELHNVVELIESLEKIKVDKEDQLIYSECKRYIEVLNDLVVLLAQ